MSQPTGIGCLCWIEPWNLSKTESTWIKTLPRACCLYTKASTKLTKKRVRQMRHIQKKEYSNPTTIWESNRTVKSMIVGPSPSFGPRARYGRERFTKKTSLAIATGAQGNPWIEPNIMELVSLETRIRNRTFQLRARDKWKRHEASTSLLQSHLVQPIVALLPLKHQKLQFAKLPTLPFCKSPTNRATIALREHIRRAHFKPHLDHSKLLDTRLQQHARPHFKLQNSNANPTLTKNRSKRGCKPIIARA